MVYILVITEQHGLVGGLPSCTGPLSTVCLERTARILPNSLRPSSLLPARSYRADYSNEVYDFYQGAVNNIVKFLFLATGLK